MSDRKLYLRIAIIAVCIVAIGLSPLATSRLLSFGAVSAKALGQPIDFTPNVKQLELTSIAETAVADGIDPPPLEFAPGQLYSEEDAPEVSQIENGDEFFGYGPSKEDSDVYILWMTDENGTHYFTVDAISDELLGMEDPATGNRAENGFRHFIDAREELKEQIQGKEMEANRDQNSRMTSHGVAVGFAIAGG